MQRGIGKLCRCAVKHQLPVPQPDDPVRIPLRVFYVVHIHNAGEPPRFYNLFDILQNILRTLRSKLRDRLIAEQDIRFLHQGAGNADALFLTAA